jgi:polyribonucleotide 5'-hydroxyl-kinase
MLRNYDQKPTSSAATTHSDERITVLKLSKSGGCVDRDDTFMKAVNENQIRSYFFGNAAIAATSAGAAAATASSASSGAVSGSNSNKITLSPHTQQLDFDPLALYNYLTTSSPADDDEDEYDPSSFITGDSSFLPGGGASDQQSMQHDSSNNTNTPYDPADSSSFSATTANTNDTQVLPLKKFTQPPTPAFANTLIAITHAAPNATLADIRDSSIMGFVYVADVDAEKKKLRVLAPVGGRMPGRALVWGKKWPGEVVGLVG